MKLRSLECLCEIAASGFNLSVAARRLSASQPTVTRQIQLLESELGYEVLRREGNKVRGLTPLGALVHERALQLLQEARLIRSLDRDETTTIIGRIAIATTNFHARHTLLKPICALRKRYPKVTVSIIPGDSASIPRLVTSCEVDMGLSVESIQSNPDLVYFPCTEIRRVALMPKGHPLERAKSLTAKLLAQYPLIVHDERFVAHRRILQVFADKGLSPDIAVTSGDIEVIKTYVLAGVGISIVPALSYDRTRDPGLAGRPVDSIFPPVTAMLTLRQGAGLRSHAREFALLLAPTMTGAAVVS